MPSKLLIVVYRTVSKAVEDRTESTATEQRRHSPRSACKPETSGAGERAGAGLTAQFETQSACGCQYSIPFADFIVVNLCRHSRRQNRNEGRREEQSPCPHHSSDRQTLHR